MILYTTFGSSNLARSISFYDAIFGALGVGRCPDWAEGWAGWGSSYDDGTSVWVCTPFNKQVPQPGNGPMVALKAKSAAEVRAFHAAALANGGTDEGPPGTRTYYEPSFYVAYVRDPDGNKLACVFHHYDPNHAS
jgi:catechol 2,3-dioxygenase-like lactoylglutathione lyase family enzyme